MSRWIPERPKNLPKRKQPTSEEVAKKLGISVEQVNKMREPHTPQTPDEIIRKIRDRSNNPEGRAQLAEFEEAYHQGYVGIIEELLKRKLITKDDLRKLIEEAA
jgi:DNA-directed RNA polymerase specialized sigma subunit